MKKTSNILFFVYLVFCYVLCVAFATLGEIIPFIEKENCFITAIILSVILVVMNVILCILLKTQNRPKKLLAVMILNILGFFPYPIIMLEYPLLLIPMTLFGYSPTLTISTFFIAPFYLIENFNTTEFDFSYLAVVIPVVLFVFSMIMYILLMKKKKEQIKNLDNI